MMAVAAVDPSLIGTLIGASITVMFGLLTVAWSLGGLRNAVRDIARRMDDIEKRIRDQEDRWWSERFRPRQDRHNP